MEKARPIWISLDQFRQVYINLNKYRQISTSIDKFGKSRTIWTSPDQFEKGNLKKIVEGIFLNDVFNFGMFVFRFFLRIMSVVRR